nr:hypothetical protein [uncultured Carboxylicivirga sp.]
METIEKNELDFVVGMAANQLMPSIIKSADINGTLNNIDGIIKRSINIAESLAKQIHEQIGEEDDQEYILMIASSATETLGAMIVRDPEGTVGNLEKRTKVAVDIVIELNKRVDNKIENVNQEEEQ